MRSSSTRGFGALALLALLGLAWRGQWAFQFGVPRAAGGWQLLGATLALFALWRIADRWVPARAGGAPRAGGREWLAAGALCALGVAFRVVHFSSAPGGMNHDAAFNGMYALHVLEGAPYTPYVSAAWGRETLFMYLCTPLVWWFGNRPEPIQIAATLVGVATLPLFYLLARALCGPRRALIGLAFLAVSGWHGVFSRVGWRMIMVPPFELLALLGLWRALERGARRDWLLTGAGAALALYTYDAGRLVLPMVGVLFAVFLLLDRRDRRGRLRGAALALATFVVIGGPMLWYAATHFEQFKARAAHLAVEEPHAGLVPTTIAAAAMFNYRGNGNDFFVNEPLLEPLSGALFAFAFLVVVSSVVGRRSSVPGEPQTDDRPPTTDDQPPARAALFILLGLALAVGPALLSVPNGNRCIAALPFVYMIIALGTDALVDTVARALPAGATRRIVAPLLIGVLVAAAGVETYREYLGPAPRPIIGFSPEATAAGEYLRRFGDDYTRYVVAEDWPEYTLAYLSYNGGGTPLENHYLLGRRLEDIEPRINRFGRKGLVFLTDMKPAGRQALERLQRLFAEHRVEPVAAPRRGGVQVATALIVEPQGAARANLWSNTTRALAVGGDAPAVAVRCFAPVGDASGVSLRLQLMRPHVDESRPAGAVRFLSRCPPQGPAPLAVGFGAAGLEVRTDHAEIAVAAAALEAGHWYEVNAVVRPDGAIAVSVDGRALEAKKTLVASGPLPLRVAGIELSAPAGAQFLVDDVAIVAGPAVPGDARWAAVRRAEVPGVFEDFEATPYGTLAADGEWRSVAGPVSALVSPAGVARAAAETAPASAGNAFDGGHGDAPGRFNQPVGIAVDAAGSIYVADRSNHRVQQFARDGSFVRTWGREGTHPGEFREPHDVAVDAEFVYVADLWNQRIQVFDHDGNPAFTITGAPSFSSPRGLFVKDRLIYVAEAGGGQVSVYDRAGARRQTIGVPGGDAPGHLVEPVDVAIDPHGDVWVVNSGNNRLERFAPDGTPRGSIPIPGWSGARLKEVYLAIDAQGTLYLSDWDKTAVRRFRPDGSELAALGDGIRQPSGVALDRGRLLVVARGDDQVRVLPLEGGKSR
jgi:sugar lactone lactonase YvrE